MSCVIKPICKATSKQRCRQTGTLNQNGVLRLGYFSTETTTKTPSITNDNTAEHSHSGEFIWLRVGGQNYLVGGGSHKKNRGYTITYCDGRTQKHSGKSTKIQLAGIKRHLEGMFGLSNLSLF